MGAVGTAAGLATESDDCKNNARNGRTEKNENWPSERSWQKYVTALAVPGDVRECPSNRTDRQTNFSELAMNKLGDRQESSVVCSRRAAGLRTRASCGAGGVDFLVGQQL
jgi:hypothetical protein